VEVETSRYINIFLVVIDGLIGSRPTFD